MVGVVSRDEDECLAKARYISPIESQRSIQLWRIFHGSHWEYVVWDCQEKYGKAGRRSGSYYRLQDYSVMPKLSGYLAMLEDKEVVKLDRDAYRDAYANFLDRVRCMIKAS